MTTLQLNRSRALCRCRMRVASFEKRLAHDYGHWAANTPDRVLTAKQDNQLARLVYRFRRQIHDKNLIPDERPLPHGLIASLKPSYNMVNMTTQEKILEFSSAYLKWLTAKRDFPKLNLSVEEPQGKDWHLDEWSAGRVKAQVTRDFERPVEKESV